MEKQITCPSGMVGEIRGLKGKEGQLLSDRAAVRNGTFLDRILEACWLRTISPGPYTVSDGGRPDWKQVLVGDRFYILLQIRIASFGEVYSFNVPCQYCRKPFGWDINLDGDLRVKSLSAEDAARFAAAQPFTVATARGTQVTYRLPIGVDEQRAARQSSTDGAFLEALSQRIVAVDGQPSVTKFLEDAEFADLIALLSAMDEHDCGVDTTITVECSNCSATQDVQLPFVRDFFVPTTGRSKR